MRRFFTNLKADFKRKHSQIEYSIAKILLRNAIKISTAESCTGGLLSSRLTDVPGSSGYTTMNFVTYSNDSKQKILNVSSETLEKFGAVSAECASEMAQGLRRLTGRDIVLCTTGVAGPSSSENKPAGLVYIACGYKDNLVIKEFRLNSRLNRKNMKFMFTEEALKMVKEAIS
jgi:PncC family amidohydrolase